MSPIEQEIIALIEQNKFLSDALKKRYILALFLMDTPAQEEYLRLWKAFDSRCQQIKKEPFVLEANDMRNVLRSVDEVKKELIQKIQSAQPN